MVNRLSFKGSVWGFVVVSVFSTVVLVYSWLAFDTVSKQHHARVAQAQEAKAKYQHAALDLALFNEYREVFNTLKTQSILGDENRLSWAEAIKATKHPAINRVNTNISPKRVFMYDDSPSSLHWSVSEQTIDAGLLHEGGFFELMQRFSKQAKGLMNVSKCHLKKSASIIQAPLADNVTARCTIRWFSLNIEQVPE